MSSQKSLVSMGLCLSNTKIKTHTFGFGVVYKRGILLTPHTPRLLCAFFLFFIFSSGFKIFPTESFKDSLDYQALKVKDFELITGYIPEFSYDVLNNEFSLTISLNSIITNSVSLYENNLKKKSFKKKYYEKILEKKKIFILEEKAKKKVLEENHKKISDELILISREINSLEKLITHKGSLLSINKEIFVYNKSQFDAGKISTIEFLQNKKAFLDQEYSYQELLHNLEVLKNEEKSKRGEISNSQ